MQPKPRNPRRKGQNPRPKPRFGRAKASKLPFKTNQRKWSFDKNPGNTVSYMEQLATVNAIVPTGSTFATRLQMNPVLFPWLTAIAAAHQRYIVMSAVIDLVSNASATQTGQIRIAYDPDPADHDLYTSQVLQQRPSAFWAAADTSSKRFRLPVKNPVQGYYTALASEADATTRQTVFGNVYVTAIGGTADAYQVDVFINYTIRFMNPSTNNAFTAIARGVVGGEPGDSEADVPFPAANGIRFLQNDLMVGVESFQKTATRYDGTSETVDVIKLRLREPGYYQLTIQGMIANDPSACVSSHNLISHLDGEVVKEMVVADAGLTLSDRALFQNDTSNVAVLTGAQLMENGIYLTPALTPTGWVPGANRYLSNSGSPYGRGFIIRYLYLAEQPNATVLLGPVYMANLTGTALRMFKGIYLQCSEFCLVRIKPAMATGTVYPNTTVTNTVTDEYFQSAYPSNAEPETQLSLLEEPIPALDDDDEEVKPPRRRK